MQEIYGYLLDSKGQKIETDKNGQPLIVEGQRRVSFDPDISIEIPLNGVIVRGIPAADTKTFSRYLLQPRHYSPGQS